jgi:4-amino-4-deoxy-L-arabinose transferase-like glycosyltransferase
LLFGNMKSATNALAWTKLDWRIMAGFFLLGILLFFPGLDSYGILDPSDGLYTEGAREMVESGNYITPYLNYQTFFDKPVLIYWLIAASYKLFGIAPWSARVPVALAGILTPVAMYAFGRQLMRRRAAVLSSLTLLSCGLFLTVGHIALIDVPLTLVTVVAMMSLFIYLRSHRFHLLIMFYAALGVSILLKGFVLVGEVGVVLALYELSKRYVLSEKLGVGWWLLLKQMRPQWGLVLVALIALPWYVAVDLATQGQFIREFFINQHLGRLAGTMNHAQDPWWFYLPFILGGSFPWSFLLVSSLPILVRSFRKRAALSASQETAIFSFWWAAVILILFNVVKTKLATYILPAFPALCILTGLLLDKWILFKTCAWRKVTVPLYIVAISAAGFFLFKFQGLHSHLDQTTLLISWAGIFVLFINCLLYGWSLGKTHVRTAVIQLVTGSCLAACLIVPSALIITYQANDAGLQDLLQLSRAANANLASYQRVSPAATFYMRQIVPNLATAEDVEAYRRSPKQPHYILCSEGNLGRFKLYFKPRTMVTYRNKLFLMSFE